MPEPTYINNVLNLHYCEDCNISWPNTWSCACNDRCPHCGTETEPYESLNIALEICDIHQCHLPA